MISELGEEKGGLTLAISDIWNKYKEKLLGGEEIGKTSYRSNEYGDMSQKRLSELLRDQFKARPPKHHGDKRQLVFDKTALDRMKQKYRINVNKNNAGTDGTDGTDTGLDRHLSEGNSDSKISKNTEENINNSSKINKQIQIKYSKILIKAPLPLTMRPKRPMCPRHKQTITMAAVRATILMYTGLKVNGEATYQRRNNQCLCIVTFAMNQ
jgi:hypothetical protein